MSQKPVSSSVQSSAVSPASVDSDKAYADFENIIANRVVSIKTPLFTTDANEDQLWSCYLNSLPVDQRQHYNCHTCRKFIQRYGGLVYVDEFSNTQSPLWSSARDSDDIQFPEFFEKACDAMRRLVKHAKITGVFLSPDKTWGVPKTGLWSHLSGVRRLPFEHKVLTADQMMAQLKEERGILCHSLADYSLDVVTQATRVLDQDALYRSEKAVEVAKWFKALHERINVVDRAWRDNVIWLAVATAPPGFCHVRSTVISTLLVDIKIGLSFDAISRRWSQKLHPLQYQRPSAAPSEGAIAAAEKLVEKLGVAKSLERRYARLEEIQTWHWKPRVVENADLHEHVGEVFSHLYKKIQPTQIELPAKLTTFEKFHKEVMPNAESIEVSVPSHGSFYGLVTAVHPDAPPILQWDGLSCGGMAMRRNPVSWYFYNGGSDAIRWGIDMGWRNVTCIFASPCHWQEPGKFRHQGDKVFFALEGCQDQYAKAAHLCLFPEILKSEFHGIRSVIEAHGRTRGISEADQGTANGIALDTNRPTTLYVRVNTADGSSLYNIDRLS